MDIETVKFTTKGGVAMELRSFITGRQKRYIMGAFLDDVNLTSNGTTQSFSIAGSKTNVATDRALESVVLSVNGSKENVVETVLDLPAADFDEIVTQVNAITDP